MMLNLPPKPERSSSRGNIKSRFSTSRSRRKSRCGRYGDDSSVISSSTPLPTTPSAGMVLDANGNDIGQALEMKISLSEVRIQDQKTRARAAKVKREKKGHTLPGGSWISMSLSNLTSDFSIDRTDSWASKNTTGSKKGRIVKETLIGDLTNSSLQHAKEYKSSSYMPSKYISHETAKNEGRWLEGLLSNYACDGRQDTEDTDSTYTAHRDDRGVVIYEV